MRDDERGDQKGRDGVVTEKLLFPPSSLSSPPAKEHRSGGKPWPAVLGLALTAGLSALPLVAEPLPVTWVAPPAGAAVGRALVVGAMTAALVVRAILDRQQGRGGFATVALFAGLAAFLTAYHRHHIDSLDFVREWQRGVYLGILNHSAEPPSEPPHVFRPLPYGFTRAMERLTGDWDFSCLAYRWFFTFWFLWASYQLARRAQGPWASLAPVALVLLLYPLSIKYYYGQLTDPVNHALFVLAMIYALEDRWLLLAATLAVAVPAKETVVLMVPAYALAMLADPRGSSFRRAFVEVSAKTFVIGAACVAAFLLVRVPLGWRPGNESLNGMSGLMIGTNLGLGEPIATTPVPLSENYRHPAIFILPFLPIVLLGWRRIDRRLRVLVAVLTPLVLLSNLCFSWMYESRNYMPLVPLLTTAALSAFPPPRLRPEATPLSAPG